MKSHAKSLVDEQVMVYGAAWCEDTARVCRLLDAWGIDYYYTDIDRDSFALRKVSRWTFGEVCVPAVSMGVLEQPRVVCPSDEELRMMLFGPGVPHSPIRLY